ncbi:MAG: hypothetical protein FWF24_03040 [Alphaproteobacteria bacterium]|nr:hypothetical protein [Alphaproteobacteria bacterium]
MPFAVSLRPFALAGFLALSLAQSAAAQDIRPVFSPEGRFSFCLAEQTYEDGRKLTFAFSQAGQINIGPHIPNAGFQQGSKYDLTLSFDQGEPYKVRAAALDENTLLLQMGSEAAFRKSLESGQSMNIGAAGNIISFDLPAMPQLLKELEQCITDHLGSHDEQAQDPLPEPLRALLESAGFTDIEPVNISGIPPEERPADYIWRTGNLIAGVRQRLMEEDQRDLDMLIGLHMSGLKNKCPGQFSSTLNRPQTVKDVQLRTAEALCAPPDEAEAPTIIVAVVFYLTPEGGFAIFTHESPEAHKDEALTARDKLFQNFIQSLERG